MDSKWTVRWGENGTFSTLVGGWTGSPWSADARCGRSRISAGFGVMKFGVGGLGFWLVWARIFEGKRGAEIGGSWFRNWLSCGCFSGAVVSTGGAAA